MVYINPIEILELKDKEVNEIDSSLIKKSKRRLFADIDLSDNGCYLYNGQKLTKSDCERAIEELEDKNKIEFYSHLSTNFELNKFLANGSNELLNNLKQESIYKLPEFVDFISPYSSAKIDHILLKSFQNKDLELFSSALRAEYLISKNDLNKAYKSLGNEIQQRIAETDKLTKEIKDETSNYTDDNIDEVVKIIKKRFPSEFLNKLPIYFQSQINKIAASINFLQLNIYNEFNTTSVPLSLLEYLLKLNIESISKPTFEKNYNIVKKKNDERIEQEENAPLLKKWAKILISIQTKVDDVENETLKSSDAFSFVKSSFDLRELNNLPSFANEIRTQIGYSIRSISIASWNKQSDIKNALLLIDYALQIDVSKNAKSKFQQDKNELEELEKKYKGVLVCHFCATNAPENGCEINTTIYNETSRSYIPRRVQFSYSDVTIPRCQNCKEIHSKGSSNYYMVFFGLLTLGAIVGGATEGEHFIIGGVIGAVAGWIIGKIIEGNQVKKGGIKDSSTSTLSGHPLLIERIRGGWTFSKPSA
jgi:outer membrane lipoprotein SlyB